jgi:hypothetical protein
MIIFGLSHLLYILYHLLWLLIANLRTIYVERKRDRILGQIKSDAKKGSNTELEAAPTNEPNIEDVEKPRWVKRIQLKGNPSRTSVFSHILTTGFVWSLVGAAGFIGLLYRPSLMVLPWLAFILVPLNTICDFILKARLQQSLDPSDLIGAIQGLNLVIGSSCFLAVSSMAALGVTYSPNAGAVAHGIIFGCFLFAEFSRQFYLRRTRNISWN